jgi:membrane protease subunit HflC
MNKAIALAALSGFIAIAGLVLLSSTFYIVTEREQVVVTRFNKPIRVIVGDRPGDDFEALKLRIQAAGTEGLRVAQGAGLYMKIPFVDVPERFPDTVLEYDPKPEYVVTRDKKQLQVDNYARWRIEDPLLFRIRVRSITEAMGRLDDIIYSFMREELGRNDLIEIIRTTKEFSDFADDETDPDSADGVTNEMMREKLVRGREEIMNELTLRTNKVTREQFGIEVIDVRIKRAELLSENLQAVFARMRAERERIAKGYVSEGERQASIIRGETDRDVAIMLAQAREKAQRLEGEGEAEALRTIAEAFSSDPDFYEFARSLEVIDNATPNGSELVIGLDSGLYKLLAQP